MSHLNTAKDLFWGWHVLGIILLTGIYLSLSTQFFQLRRLPKWLKSSFCGEKQTKSSDGISKFQALSTALAGTIGTGNIVGVAVAITVGGAGAVFWMWVSAIFGMMTIFAENVLASKYKNAPGPLGYIEKAGRHGRGLAFVYATGCVLSSFGMGNMVQVNAAASSLEEFGMPRLLCAAVIGIILLFVAMGGLKSAAKITERLVPLMTLIFFAASLCVLFVFRDRIPDAFINIFEGAFSLRAGAGGTAGMLIAMKTGISRGVFTNEAGLGSASFAYSAVDEKDPVSTGYMGIFQVFADTIVMCTVTALCILCSFSPDLDGAELTFFAFESALGSIGNYAITICTALFAFATTVAWCCYGREALFYIAGRFGKKRPHLTTGYAAAFAATAFIGCVIPLDIIFAIGDAFNGLMAIPNILALLYFASQVVKLTKQDDRICHRSQI